MNDGDERAQVDRQLRSDGRHAIPPQRGSGQSRPALLQDPEHRARYRDQVVWDRADSMLNFGGIRIEDNVLITPDGHEVTTSDVPLLG